jgi:outer membrane immunogenic protein
LNYLDISKSYSSTGTTIAYIGSFTNTSNSKSSINWLSTVRGRAGYSLDKTLIYVTGGLAFGDTKSSSSSTGTDGSNTDIFSGSKSSVRFGGVIGAGAEYALTDKLSARLEAEYFNLGKTKYTINSQNEVAVSEGITTVASHRFDGETVRFGINYKF